MKALLIAAMVVVGLFVAGSIVVWAVHALLSVLGYVLVGALVVGAVVFIAGKARKAVNGGNRQQLR